MSGIKFKVFHKATSKMYTPGEDGTQLLIGGLLEKNWSLWTFEGEICNQDDAVLCKNFGFKDKNEITMYDGSIVKYEKIVYEDCSRKTIERVEEPLIGEFYFAEGLYPGLRFSDGTGHLFYPGTLKSEDFELIGDIYQNPDLLEMFNERCEINSSVL